MNPKSDLMALAAARGLGAPRFEVSQDGPPHEPRFVATVFVGEQQAEGEGRNKREAEREAALAALHLLHGDEEEEPLPQRPLPIYAEVLSEALIVAHKRAPKHAGVDEVRSLTVQLYRGLLRDLGALEDG